MEKINYDLKLKTLLGKLDKKYKLLIHACCGPCSSYVLEYLKDYFDISIYYYNPNIFPDREYYRRMEEVKKFVSLKKYNIDFIEGDYIPSEFYEVVKDNHMLGEKSIRCFNCYKLRMEKAAEYAKDNGFDYFTTTLSISPHKNSDWINQIGFQLEDKYKINYLYADFKKNNGYKRSLELSKENNLYRQEYCGCVYSMKERGLLDDNKKNN